MVWKRFSHEVGFGTRACLERVCVREKHPLTDSIPINRGGMFCTAKTLAFSALAWTFVEEITRQPLC